MGRAVQEFTVLRRLIDVNGYIERMGCVCVESRRGSRLQEIEGEWKAEGWRTSRSMTAGEGVGRYRTQAERR